MDTDSFIVSRSAPNTYFAPKVVNSTDAVCVEAPVRSEFCILSDFAM